MHHVHPGVRDEVAVVLDVTYSVPHGDAQLHKTGVRVRIDESTLDDARVLVREVDDHGL